VSIFKLVAYYETKPYCLYWEVVGAAEFGARKPPAECAYNIIKEARRGTGTSA
jgi:hypothetical protein